MSELSCTKRFCDIPFAHRQFLHDGHCSLIHGHNWDVEVEFTARRADPNGFIVDFGKLKCFKAVLSKFDHAFVLRFDDPLSHKLDDSVCNLIEIPDASSEGLAKHFFGEFSLLLDTDEELFDARERGAIIKRVTVYEDSKNSATYTP